VRELSFFVVLLHLDPMEPTVLRWSLYLYYLPSALIVFSFLFSFSYFLCVFSFHLVLRHFFRSQKGTSFSCYAGFELTPYFYVHKAPRGIGTKNTRRRKMNQEKKTKPV